MVVDVIVLICHRVLIGEADQVLITGGLVAQCMIGTVGNPMTGQRALLMGDTAVGHLFEGREVERLVDRFMAHRRAVSTEGKQFAEEARNPVYDRYSGPFMEASAKEAPGSSHLYFCCMFLSPA
ncbi:hypothetical protein Hdeb2414_s0005g00155451 [Helianthus debilis subsp. tardiflorus]